MTTPSPLSIPWLDHVINSNWWPILLPLGYGTFRLAEYIVKRQLESKPETETIEQYSMLADLQAKLQTNGMTISSLKLLRSEMLGKEATTALDVASRYNSVARDLVSDVEQIDRPQGVGLTTSSSQSQPDEAFATQAEMNAFSAQKAREADEELTAIVVDLMQRLSGDAAASLQRAQDIWHEYRREESRRAGLAVEGGSMQPLFENAKNEAMTRERIAALRGDTKDLEGSVLSVRRSKTPTNLFEHIHLGVPAPRVQEILGIPTYIHSDTWIYRFVETQLEITFADTGGTSCAVLALCHGHIYSGFNEVTDIPLGQLTMADLLEIDPQATLEFFHSARTVELYVRIRVGPPGAWTDYCFGALTVVSGAGHLQHTEFEWDYEASKLLSDPSDVLVNWIAFPSSITDPPSFYWFIET